MLSSDYDDSFNSIMQNYIFILRTQPKFLNIDTYHVVSNKKNPLTGSTWNLVSAQGVKKLEWWATGPRKKFDTA